MARSFVDGLSSDVCLRRYLGYDALRNLIEGVAEKNKHILLAGCGSSNMAADMHADGYTSVMNVDISRVIIDEMQRRYASISRLVESQSSQLTCRTDLDGVRWMHADLRNVEGIFENKVFDVVIDKALLDALYGAENPHASVLKYLKEMDRVLTPVGVLVCVSCGPPERRLGTLENTEVAHDDFLAWEVEVHAIPKAALDPCAISNVKVSRDVYYVYLCRKNEWLHRQKEDKKKLAQGLASRQQKDAKARLNHRKQLRRELRS